MVKRVEVSFVVELPEELARQMLDPDVFHRNVDRQALMVLYGAQKVTNLRYRAADGDT